MLSYIYCSIVFNCTYKLYFAKVATRLSELNEIYGNLGNRQDYVYLLEEPEPITETAASKPGKFKSKKKGSSKNPLVSKWANRWTYEECTALVQLFVDVTERQMRNEAVLIDELLYQYLPCKIHTSLHKYIFFSHNLYRSKFSRGF